MNDAVRRGSLGRFFAGMCEYIFQTHLGVVDPPLVDYLSDMLLRFVSNDTLCRVRDLSGRPVTEVAGMILEAEHRRGLAKRDVHRHIGDVALFWTGVFPESLPKLRRVDSRDFLIDYCSQGKRAYHIAATIETDRTEDATADVLERLSNHFEMCAYGLGEVRREWERRDEGDPKLLIS
ncbi:conserved hypothetical protein [Pirellula staleyi DSM 6068]|uniref:Uncharacterized protein n=1 Tax=Pirellula staleyi (strain ATCC 27377 / DSM 6068 / ICPB 4128) TaxID=530564 RepID=D2R0X8_PIRSD|nr:hypothetical protein [Pirellula staleyi]ADB18463.1 conserved hypothetical protein [Pirellula staleyi DSM 6068]